MNQLALVLALAFFSLAAPQRSFADDKAATPDDGGARLVPLMRDGKPAGYKVYAIAPGGRFATQHFENGDTILKVDGEPVTTDKGSALLHGSVVEGKADARVDIVRKGQPMVITTAKR